MIEISYRNSITWKSKTILSGSLIELCFYLDNTNHHIHWMNNSMDIEANQLHAMDNVV
jgi:hypothetical protein